MDINDKIARCRLIATLIVADDEVDDREIALLERTMVGLEMSDEEKARSMVVMGEEVAAEALKTLSREERVGFLNHLAEVAWVDGHLGDYEVEVILRVAKAMGLGKSEVDGALKAYAP